MDGVLQQSKGTDATAMNNTNIAIGSLLNNTNYFTGNIAEVLVFDHTLNVPERRVVEQYLKERYDAGNYPTFATVDILEASPATDPNVGV